MGRLDRPITLLLLLRVLVFISVAAAVPNFPSAAAGRFYDIAHAAGLPYRNFPVEYPIGQLGLIEVIGTWDLGTVRVILATLAFLSDVAAFGALAVGWGLTVAKRYLVIGTPLLIFLYRRLDLVAVALVAIALAQAHRGRERSAGAWLGAGVLVRLWPAVLMPVLAVRRLGRGIGSFAVVVASGLAGWLLIGGVEGLRQVGSFRGASGWELESTVGAVVWAVTGEYRFEQGANRTGVVPSWARVVLVLLLLIGLVFVWLRAWRAPHDPAGAPGLAAVALLMVLSPLLSPQFVSWLLPMAAIASLDERRWLSLGALPIAITGGIVTLWYLDVGLGPGWNQALLTLRNVTLLAIPCAWLFLPSRETRHASYAGVRHARGAE